VGSRRERIELRRGLLDALEAERHARALGEILETAEVVVEQAGDRAGLDRDLRWAVQLVGAGIRVDWPQCAIRVADQAGAAGEQGVGAGREARADRSRHRAEVTAQVRGTVGGDQRARALRRLENRGAPIDLERQETASSGLLAICSEDELGEIG
jgi:hypothetical protein